MTDVMTMDQAKALREPFKPEQIGKLPKSTKKDNAKGRCPECGGWHGLPAVHLDYVGHAAITDRLLQVDPGWTWEPMVTDERGFPVFDSTGGLWIRLTVAGVSRPGYGDETNGKGVKEIIGDALRNAAMRFGVGLDLWSKEDLNGDGEVSAPSAPAVESGAAGSGVGRPADPHGLQASRADAVIPGQVIVPFGKHKGVQVKDVPRSYWDWWLAQTGSKDPVVLAAVELHLGLEAVPYAPELDADVPF